MANTIPDILNVIKSYYTKHCARKYTKHFLRLNIMSNSLQNHWYPIYLYHSPRIETKSNQMYILNQKLSKISWYQLIFIHPHL